MFFVLFSFLVLEAVCDSSNDKDDIIAANIAKAHGPPSPFLIGVVLALQAVTTAARIAEQYTYLFV